MRRFYVALIDAGPAIGTPLRVGCVVVSDDLDAFPEHEQTILGPAQMDAPCPEWAATEFCRLYGLSEETEVEYDLKPPPGTQDPDRYAPTDPPPGVEVVAEVGRHCRVSDRPDLLLIAANGAHRAAPLPVPEQGTLFA